MNSVASDQHNHVNNIKMIKGVHQLTLRTNILISLIDHFTMFNGWMNSQADPCAVLGFVFFFVFFFLGGGGGGGWGGGVGFRPDGQNTGSTHWTNSIRTYVCTYARTDRLMNIHAQEDG